MKTLRTLSLLAGAVMALASHAASLKVSVVDADGTPVEEAVITVAPAHGSAPKVTPGATTIVKQEKMQFVPKVALVTPGTKLRFLNMDPWDHHVRGTTGNQFGVDYVPAFQLRQAAYVEGKPPVAAEYTAEAPGVVLLGCHLHSSMTGYVYVTDTPWATKTNADGIASLDDLPAGDVKVTIWQANEIRIIPVKTVTLGAAVTQLQEKLSVRVRKRRV